MALGDYLKELREERKMTTYEVAKISGVNQSYISQMERGQKHPYPTNADESTFPSLI